jgi:long-chain acyl-CoA synthetase
MNQDLQLKSGIEKIVDKGTLEPEAVRFHVPTGIKGQWEKVTWGEVLRCSRQIALYLDSMGIGEGDKVSVFANTRLEWAFCTPAIEACRAVFVPVYFSNTPDQTSYVVNHSDAQVLFTELALLPKVVTHWERYEQVREVIVWDLERDDQLAALLDPAVTGDLSVDRLKEKIVPLSTICAQGQALHDVDPLRLERLLGERRENDAAAIIYTSGTTGLPKGVLLTNHNLASSARSWHEVLEHAFPEVGQRRDILWLPISHMSGWGILGQGTMYDYETWFADPFTLLQILPEVKPTMLLSVPAYWEKMYSIALNTSDDPAQQHARLRELTGGCLSFLLSGGAGLKREVKDFFLAAGIQMIEGYGLTECSPNLTMNRLDDYDFNSVGKPMPGVELKLADDGEIVVKGANVFSGYYKDAEATAECFDEQGWFCTGDLGQWTGRGEAFLKITGRKKEIIATSGGKKIGPAGVEAQFVGQPLIEHIVLYGNERKYLTALVTLNEAAVRDFAQRRRMLYPDYAELATSPEVHAEVQRLVDEVNANLASYETIKKFYVHPGHLTVNDGHLTPSLKLRRKQVWHDFEAQYEALYAPTGRPDAARARARA